jgi:hypothetical protein
MRSDTKEWEDFSGRWANSTSLKMIPTAPGRAHSWNFLTHGHRKGNYPGNRSGWISDT